jgi:hypothetical protein
VYDESPSLLARLAVNLTCPATTLVILVLNQPECSSNPNCNNAMREAINQLELVAASQSQHRRLNNTTELYLLDRDKIAGPIPTAQGVGLARKLGCDLALSWQSGGHIKSSWICSSDADAELPEDYFQRLAQASPKSAAAVYPFSHHPGNCAATNHATALYELRLHHYVLGLEYAKSPYAYHTLGSALAIHKDCYAQVRGFPKRAGGEDFYLLNKAAKTGTVARLRGSCIALASRTSHRVPFGTGPAVRGIVELGDEAEQTLFYHPQCFEALRLFLQAVPALSCRPPEQLHTILVDLCLTDYLVHASCTALLDMGLEDAIAHCRRQGKTPAQFMRQFHQWFDGFRTLKFIHALRDSHLPKQSLKSLPGQLPSLWPANTANPTDIESLRSSIREYWGWGG